MLKVPVSPTRGQADAAPPGPQQATLPEVSPPEASRVCVCVCVCVCLSVSVSVLCLSVCLCCACLLYWSHFFFFLFYLIYFRLFNLFFLGLIYLFFKTSMAAVPRLIHQRSVCLSVCVVPVYCTDLLLHFFFIFYLF